LHTGSSPGRDTSGAMPRTPHIHSTNDKQNISHSLPHTCYQNTLIFLHARLQFRLKINLTKTYYLCTQESKLFPRWSKYHYICHITFFSWAFKPAKY
jgi:hypothetical protein